jgi:hypothetical protein
MNVLMRCHITTSIDPVTLSPLCSQALFGSSSLGGSNVEDKSMSLVWKRSAYSARPTTSSTPLERKAYYPAIEARLV